MRDKFIFYESWARSLSSLPDRQRLLMLDAMLQYFLTGERPDMDDVMANAFFMQIASQMNRDAEAWEAKCAKNRENATKKKRTQANATDGNQSLPIAVGGAATGGQCPKGRCHQRNLVLGGAGAFGTGADRMGVVLP